MALQYYDRALQLAPDLAQAVEYRAETLAEMGEKEKAMAELERLRPLDKQLAERLEKFLNNMDELTDDSDKW
jgi:tetratricopeptide (TPR) repeat protein